jgi:hypothetical protein
VAAPIVLAPYENGFTRKNPGALANSFSPAITHDIEVWRWIGAIRPGKPSGSQVDGAMEAAAHALRLKIYCSSYRLK